MATASRIIDSKTNYKPMLWLAVPVVIEQFLVLLVTWTDHWLTAKYLYTEHLAAINLTAYILWVIPCIFGIIGVGATALVARYFGAGKYRDASFVTNQAILLALTMLTVITTIAWLYADSLIAIMQLPDDATQAAIVYFRIVIPGIPFAILHMISNACLRGAGDIMSGFITMFIVNVVNVILSLCLVTGYGPFPELGWDGIAYGTAIGYMVGGTIIIGFLVKGRFHLKLHLSQMKPNWDVLSRLLKIGVPGGIDMMCMVMFQMWFLTIINSLGSVQAAAHGTAIRIEAMAYLPGHAFSIAATTLVGQFLGANRPDRATRSILLACAWGGTLMIGAGAAFYFGAEILTGLFIGDNTREAVTLAAPLIQIVAISMPALAIVIIMTGSLRGAGDTKWPLLFSIIGLLGIRIPLAYYLCWETISIPFTDIVLQGMNLGVRGAWYAMVVDISVRSVLVFARFLHGGWKTIRV
ncbi:MAG TPA: MATE family efflux transporter [Planctomycetaceae bacterium]|nr:MATE family efflux transporter [Planctomycetaceae bacterium]